MATEQQAFHTQHASDVSVKLRFFDIPAGESLLNAALNPASDKELKAKALKNLGIVPQDGESPLDSWLRAMAEENGLPVQKPAHRAIADAILYSSAQKFVWFLA